MSVSLQSYESIVDTANKFYHKNLPLRYSQQDHVPILLNIIGYIMHERTLSVVFTSVQLIEPIYHIDKTIIISKSLLAFYMNQPVRIDNEKVMLKEDVDLFDGLLLGSERPLVDSTCMRLGQADLTDRFSDDEFVRFTYVLRLVLLVAHWHQHYSKSIPYKDHSRFRMPELANRIY